MKVELVAAAMLVATCTIANAAQAPTPGKHDQRVRFVPYDPYNITRVWTTPGAILTIKFADDEIVGPVAVSDSELLKIDEHQNYLMFKPHGCLIPEPVVVLNRLPDHSYRHYSIQFETRPQICNKTSAPIVSASLSNDQQVGNIKNIPIDGLAEDADVSYLVVYTYPGDDAAKRRESSARQREAHRKAEAKHLLDASVSFDTQDPYSGTRNLRYMWRGDLGLMPRWAWDNGYSTVVVYPGQQRMPTVYYPDAGRCDGKENTANYSVHGDAMIIQGTSQSWCLRDGPARAIQLWNLPYNPVGSTPGTGTISPSVRRVLKDASK